MYHVCVGVRSVSEDNLLELVLLPSGYPRIRFRSSDWVGKAFTTELSHQPQVPLSLSLK